MATFTLSLQKLECVRVTRGASEVDYAFMQVNLDDATMERLPNNGFHEMTLGSVWHLEEYEGLGFRSTAQVKLFVEVDGNPLELGSYTFRGGELPPLPIPFVRDDAEYLLTAEVS